MTHTELLLSAVFKGPVVPLQEICDRYLGMSWHTARTEAALNRLPFPTFRVAQSQKAPLMVRVSDLASHLDKQAECAKQAWEHSQV